MVSSTLQTLFQQALALHQSGRLAEAKAIYQELLRQAPDDPDLLRLLGMAESRLGNAPEGMRLLEKSLQINPNQPAGYNNYGLLLLNLNRAQEAIEKFERALALNPDYAVAHNNRGNALTALKRLDEAVASYDRALALEPGYAEAHYNRGIALHDLKRFDEAIASFDRALALEPNSPEVLINRGVALQDLQRLEEALENYEDAIALKPDYAEAYNNRGNALKDLKRYDAALASFEQAIALKPDYAEAYNNRGNALKDLKRYDAALASFEQAIALKSGYAEAFNNLGNIQLNLKKYEAALANYEQAIALKPEYAEAYYNRGNAYLHLKKHEAALASYEQAIALNPDKEYLLGRLSYTRMLVCDWSRLDIEVPQLIKKITEGEKAVSPFPVLALITDLAIQRKSAEIYVQHSHPEQLTLGPIPKRCRGKKIRIGYFSSDYRNHPVSILMAELFELHDRSRFEWYGFSFGEDDQSELRKRIVNAFDAFIDVQDKSDKQVAELSREMNIDIAIDLGGFTDGARTDIFAMRAAPIQVSYIGYLGTMGAPYIDYLLADKVTIPDEYQQYYSEKIAYLPNYQVNDSKRCISDKIFSREELGLPKTGFVFCCFNNNYKIMPNTFNVWMGILKRVEGSVLFLYAENEAAAANLRKEAKLRGVDPGRLVFGKRLPQPDYLARYRVADLFLDTLPYNAGTTASDALWAGLPVLTSMGESFASRVAASVLNAIGLPELITTTQEAYEALAIELATNPDKLNRIKQKLQENRLTAPLFNTPSFAKHIEAAYTAMHERFLAGLAPEHIYIEE